MFQGARYFAEYIRGDDPPYKTQFTCLRIFQVKRHQIFREVVKYALCVVAPKGPLLKSAGIEENAVR